MTAYVALLRAVNVAGTGKLPMSELKRMGEECGFGHVRTFIASGNLLFTSADSEKKVQACLAARVADFFGREVPIFVRSAKEMADLAAANPFDDDKGSRVMAHVIDAKPTQAMLDEARNVAGERMALGPRAIYVSYGEGIGSSKLKLPAVASGTARNMNSIGKIAALLGAMP
ncbi:uncharacterized protein (DUF1697 family) [Sphingomonas kaistensis]|uniref:Uncharacterized protein (DUF1697 family) n=1 Tax=Sphingomonas kaistensis TaxID=298708 RepID=A0A7X5Y5M0_9SPHN|nr:uncharacterized protein (DUF1697 family) [Sphingomonas kaistensis]